MVIPCQSVSHRQGDARLVALDLGLTVMYDFVDFSRDNAATSFPSVMSQVNAYIFTRATVNTHETVCTAFKGSLMRKVDD